MRKFIVTLLGCFLCFQSGYAALSNLNESLAVLEAIETSPLLQAAIPQNEYIIEIERKTKSFSATTVRYAIKTIRFAESSSGKVITIVKKYIATLSITPNPGIGPNIITVLSVEKASSHSNLFFFPEANLEGVEGEEEEQKALQVLEDSVEETPFIEKSSSQTEDRPAVEDRSATEDQPALEESSN